MTELSVNILVDYESPLARRVAGDVWSGLARASAGEGRSRTKAFWESLRERGLRENVGEARVRIFVIGQDEPEAVEEVVGAVSPGTELYGVVVAVPGRPSPLAGPLLYQAVERLNATGVRAGAVEPALLHAVPEEGESYARRLLERLGSRV
ncbi:MAG: hypothetical protein K6T51_03145 [Rubrobacteraceae bacterium]|uniref:hypothetical protein n=1 Tax=Rubrobacter naiadicus TaxID=1392641 RepID=UPI002360EC3B|nr:hypothetical protein [Rubrobacter naiadicus]MBX6764519.1 hypothetical protein [Rubrobacteraceae bacterium]MCL6437583.1 hypothetical protein [Rubrobacteraceae bacterium]